jgi:hypothetical protein
MLNKKSEMKFNNNGVMVSLSNHVDDGFSKTIIVVMKQLIFLLLICLMMITSSCNRKYRGMCREDREKMKIVERFHKGQARGGCPADRARIAKEKEEEKLAKKSRAKAAKK